RVLHRPRPRLFPYTTLFRSMASSGVSNIVGRMAGQADMANQYSNPPAFLGTAMAANFNGQFWTLVTRLNPDNASLVHSAYGYPRSEEHTSELQSRFHLVCRL